MKRLFPIISLLSCLIAARSFAGSATWSANPVSGDWNTAANWIPATVPNGPGDVATFSTSSITNISFSGNILLSEVVFAADAAPYNIAVDGPFTVTLVGAGITNSSSKTQHIDLNGNASVATMLFLGSSSAGNSGIKINANGGPTSTDRGGVLEFHDTSSAGSSTLIASTKFTYAAPTITFFDQSSAGTSTISVATQISSLTFTDSSTAGQSTITISDGAFLDLIGTSNAGSAQITLERGYPYLGPTAYAGPNASIVGNTSSIIQVDGQNDVQVTINDGYLSAGSDSYKSPSVGSIAGDDLIVLNRGSTLTVGCNNLSTEFDGAIINDEDTGRCGGLTKVGTGTLTLTAAQEYCLGTTVNSGVLLVKNTSGSGAGGVVHVNGGTLGGRGIISENVAVGTGSGTGAVLAPSQGASNPTTITLQKLLTFKADGSYLYRLNTKKATADQVIAQGVKIDSGAQFNFKVIANKKLTAGAVFTAISNTAPIPIKGAFANLADGATVTVGVNKLQVSYSGGDGNDLTLTVVD